MTTSWREYRLFVTDAAYVLGRDEDAAAEAHALVSRTDDLIRAELGTAAGRGLIIALSFEDELPIADPATYASALHSWRERVTGMPQQEVEMQRAMRGRDGKSIELAPDLPLRLISCGVPLDDTLLALPLDLVASAEFIAIAPTSSCIARATDAMVDAACEAQGIGSFQLLALSAIGMHPAKIMQERLEPMALIGLIEAMTNALDQKPDSEQLLAMLKRAGIAPANARVITKKPRERPLEPGEPTEWNDVSLVTADGGAALILGPQPNRTLLKNLAETRWPAFADLRMEPLHEPATQRAIESAGRLYAHLPQKNAVPTQEDAEALDALYRQIEGNRAVYLFGDHQYAAALIAAHAYYVRGEARERALEVAEQCGAGTLHPALEQLWK